MELGARAKETETETEGELDGRDVVGVDEEANEAKTSCLT